MPDASDILQQDSCECKTLPVHELFTACSSDVENLTTVDREAELSAEADVIEVIQQSPLAAVSFTDEPKSKANCTADAVSVGSVDFTASDLISSSVIDSPSSHQQQPFESLSSTPEHLISDSSVSNFVSDCTEGNIADDVPQPYTETASLVEPALDIQSPDHKRTRRHAQKHGGRTKKKHRKAVQQPETKLFDDLMNPLAEVDTISNDLTSDVQSLSEQLDLGTFQCPLTEKDQHSQVVPDATVTVDFATQVVRHPSYLKAIGIRSENAVASQQQNNCGDVAESGITQASKDHSSSLASDKTGSKLSCYLLLVQGSYSRTGNHHFFSQLQELYFTNMRIFFRLYRDVYMAHACR